LLPTFLSVCSRSMLRCCRYGSVARQQVSGIGARPPRVAMAGSAEHGLVIAEAGCSSHSRFVLGCSRRVFAVLASAHNGKQLACHIPSHWNVTVFLLARRNIVRRRLHFHTLGDLRRCDDATNLRHRFYELSNDIVHIIHYLIIALHRTRGSRRTLRCGCQWPEVGDRICRNL
jgi:hypothetical protein